MPEKKDIKSLEKAGFRSHSNTIEGNIPYQGEKANELYERFYELVELREIPNTTLKRANIDGREYLIISNKVKPEVEVHLAFKTEKYGKDLKISILFAHYDSKAFQNQQTLGIVFIGIGILTCWTGFGLLSLGFGIILSIGAKNKFRSEFEPERDSFYNTILSIFEEACEESDIDFDAKRQPYK